MNLKGPVMQRRKPSRPHRPQGLLHIGDRPPGDFEPGRTIGTVTVKSGRANPILASLLFGQANEAKVYQVNCVRYCNSGTE